ncbi:Acetyl-CoA synthetase-like protein [Mycena kentingensis (nom. inval.)]|nr:Acetyl-CoA synthetase-like protein [Mycena kentingensis (nom. inval.)]
MRRSDTSCCALAAPPLAAQLPRRDDFPAAERRREVSCGRLDSGCVWRWCEGAGPRDAACVTEIDWTNELTSADAEESELWPGYGSESPDTLSPEANSGLLAYFHTSGSTGHPKLIPWRHRWLLVCSVQQIRVRKQVRGTYFSQMPPFHASGALLGYSMILGRGSWWNFIDVRQPPTAASVLRNLAIAGEQAAARGSPLEAVMPPSIMEAIVDGDKAKLADNLK